MTFQRQTDKSPFRFPIIFLGMNPVKDNAHSRTKENIREIRHIYLDLGGIRRFTGRHGARENIPDEHEERRLDIDSERGIA